MELGYGPIIVATKAFGMGIDKPDIRNVIRNGVPESILSWTQELGRAGRDGNQACATILYRKSDISHANLWVLNNIGCKERCSKSLVLSQSLGSLSRLICLESAAVVHY